MKYPLKHMVLERLRALNYTVDTDLLKEFNKNGSTVTMRELNRVLLTLEILGLVSVRWMSKGKRRIEFVESSTQHNGRSRPE